MSLSPPSPSCKYCCDGVYSDGGGGNRLKEQRWGHKAVFSLILTRKYIFIRILINFDKQYKEIVCVTINNNVQQLFCFELKQLLHCGYFCTQTMYAAQLLICSEHVTSC